MLWVKQKCPYILSTTVVTAIQSRSSMCDTINLITVETAAVSWWKKKPPPPPPPKKSQQTNKNTSQWRNQLKKMSTPLFEAHRVWSQRCTDCSAKLSTVKVKQNKTKTVNDWIKCILSVQTSCQNQGYHRYQQRENDHLASIYQFMCDTNLHISYAVTEPVQHHYLFNVYQSYYQSFFDKKAA